MEKKSKKYKLKTFLRKSLASMNMKQQISEKLPFANETPVGIVFLLLFLGDQDKNVTLFFQELVQVAEPNNT